MHWTRDPEINQTGLGFWDTDRELHTPIAGFLGLAQRKVMVSIPQWDFSVLLFQFF